MTPQEFSARIKEKNPSLQNVDDIDLARKIIARYPEYENDVDFGVEVPQPIPAVQNNQDGGFLSNIKNALLNRGKQMTQTWKDTAIGKINPLSTGLQTIGAVAGAAGDIIGEGIKTIPGAKPAIEKTAETYGKFNKAIGGASPEELGQLYGNFKDKHPEAAKDLESIVDIATIFPGYKGAAEVGKIAGTVAEKTGQNLVKGAEKSALEQGEKFSAKLVKPIDTKLTKEADVSRTSETGSGIFKRSIIEPTKSEKMAGQAVQKVPGVSPSNTFQQNFNIIRDYNVNLAKNLEKDVADANFIVPKQEIVSKLNKAAVSLSESPLIVGDAEKMANRLIEGAKKIINENPGTGSGLLKARKDFDAWVKSQKPKAFDAPAENAFTMANREVRNAFNDLLEAKAPDIRLKDRLSEQHALYNALDAITPKAAVEADTAVGRGVQSMKKALSLKTMTVQSAAALAGIGGLGAAATFAPIVAAMGIPAFLLYKGGKALMKPGVRKIAGETLKTASKGLPPATGITGVGVLDQLKNKEE